MTHPASHSRDVIVVGAGPAGATLAYELSSKGIDVFILEKERLPRYKACAGGITVKTARLLGFDFASLTRDTVHGARVVYGGKWSFTRYYPKPLIYTVMRDEFDQSLVQRARGAGAKLAENERVRHIRDTGQGIQVETENNAFTAQVVAGADGARSVVAASAGLMQKVDLGIGLEAEISVPGQRLVQWEGLMGLDLGHVRGGYGWIFPKGDHLSVGVGSPLHRARQLKSGYRAVLKSHGLSSGAAIRIRSHWLPVRRKGTAIQSGRCLLLGDAAGLVDPVTGEGIYNAIRSARAAAPVIVSYLKGGSPDLKEYETVVDREITPELRAARALARGFAWFPGFVFDAVENSERLWNACCRLLRGEDTYVTLKRRLGPAQVPVSYTHLRAHETALCISC
ncbi:MAG: geranylgeranyl reductase family protein, partial [Dehalococcoidia bacterium]|nr:geranylgeranyl reductase family protein [Dehalococcoidia bacterium]